MVLQPAAAGFGGAGGGVGSAEGRHLPDLLLRSRALSVQREGQDPQGRQDDLQGDCQRRAGARDPAPLLFSEGVQKGRIGLQQFVALTATNHPRLYGLYPRKGTIAVGSDADFAIWDADKKITIRWKDLHDNVGYTPYEGREIRGWPITVVSRGRVIVEDGKLHAERGSGQFLPCASPELFEAARSSGTGVASDVALRSKAVVLVDRAHQSAEVTPRGARS